MVDADRRQFLAALAVELELDRTPEPLAQADRGDNAAAQVDQADDLVRRTRDDRDAVGDEDVLDAADRQTKEAARRYESSHSRASRRNRTRRRGPVVRSTSCRMPQVGARRIELAQQGAAVEFRDDVVEAGLDRPHVQVGRGAGRQAEDAQALALGALTQEGGEGEGGLAVAVEIEQCGQDRLACRGQGCLGEIGDRRDDPPGGSQHRAQHVAQEVGGFDQQDPGREARATPGREPSYVE